MRVRRNKFRDIEVLGVAIIMLYTLSIVRPNGDARL